MSLQLVINPDDHATFGPCPCCGNMTERVWGYVEQDQKTIAAYFVEWTPGHVEQAANFDFILGKWGDDSSSRDRRAVALAFRQLETGPSFMAINAVDRPVGKNPLVGEALSREQVINKPIATTAFAVCDLIFLEDERLEPLRERTQPPAPVKAETK